MNDSSSDNIDALGITENDLKPAGTVAAYIGEMIKKDARSAREVIKVDFLSSAILELFHIRRRAGFTQDELADRLNTTQSAIARLERDLNGGISLHRYVDYCLACGVAPVGIEYIPLEDVPDHVISKYKEHGA